MKVICVGFTDNPIKDQATGKLALKPEPRISRQLTKATDLLQLSKLSSDFEGVQ